VLSHDLLFRQFVDIPQNPDRERHMAFLKFGEDVLNDSSYSLSHDELVKYAIFSRWLD
jgi:hypothetical protein